MPRRYQAFPRKFKTTDIPPEHFDLYIIRSRTLHSEINPITRFAPRGPTIKLQFYQIRVCVPANEK